jgi:hypothetical protein
LSTSTTPSTNGEAARGNARGRPMRTSGWALVALLCSLGVFCPVLTIVGPVLGVIALREIGRSDARRGRGLAWAAIVLGAVVTAAWAGGGIWWHVNVRRPLLSGPQAELRAGFAGDVAAFKAGFTSDGASASDAEARSFLNALSSRYGTFIEASLDMPDDADAAAVDRHRPVLPYRLVFDGQTVQGEAAFVIADAATGRLLCRFDWLIVYDDRLGNLRYPPSEDPASGAAPEGIGEQHDQP